MANAAGLINKFEIISIGTNINLIGNGVVLDPAKQQGVRSLQ